MLQRIVDEIGEAAAQRLPAHGHDHRGSAIETQPSIGAGALRGGDRILHELRQVRALHVFATFPARKFEIFVEHVLHLDHVFLQRLSLLAHHGELQAHARQRCFQIVAHAREHFGALLHIAVNALAHGDEGLCRAADFRCAIGLEVRHHTSLAEGFRHEGQPFDRPHLIAQEENRNAEQEQR